MWEGYYGVPAGWGTRGTEVLGVPGGGVGSPGRDWEYAEGSGVGRDLVFAGEFWSTSGFGSTGNFGLPEGFGIPEDFGIQD